MIEVKRSVCPLDCPDTCGLLVGVENQKAVWVRGDPEHPFTRGAVCVKMRHYPERVHGPLRIQSPLKRTGPKGSGRFEPISWEEALDIIEDRFIGIMSEHGPQAILPYSYAGTEGVLQFHAGHAFFHRLGASRLARTICSAALEAGFAASLGRVPTTDIETVVDSDLILIWGSNTLATNLHAWPFFQKARKKGARLVVIDPYANRTAKRADRHLRVIPGTDAALALGLMHVLIRENLIDRDYVERHALGFERFKDRVREYPPERVREITGIAERDIVTLARSYGEARAPFIRMGWGPSRQTNGGMAARTIALLPVLVGALGKKGGGLTRGTAPAADLNIAALTREDWSPPGTRTVNMVRLGQALTQLDAPRIMALFVYHSNPAVVAPNSAQVLAGLRREDLFTVVHEIVMTETALTADLVLPGATSLEVTDLYKSYGHYYLQMARPVIPVQGQGRSALTVFQQLAPRFGMDEPVFSLGEEDLIRLVLPKDSPSFQDIDFAGLAEGRPLRLRVEPWTQGFATPSGKAEFFSESLAAQGFDPLPDGAPAVDLDGRGRFPLRLITPPRAEFLNSTFGEVPSLLNRAGQPTVMIHPGDASKRNLEENEIVRVFNERGECYLHARITEDASPGLAVIEGLIWPRFMPLFRGVNQLTSQKLTDMGGGCAFHCNLVEIESAA